MKYGDVWAGVLVAALGAVAASVAWPLDFWSDFGPGPSFLPVSLGFGLVVLGIAVAVAGLLGHEDTPVSHGNLRKPMQVAGVMLVYLALLDIVGFTLATTLFFFVLIYWVESRRLWQSLVLAVVASAAVYFVFVSLLKVPLPVGLLKWTY